MQFGVKMFELSKFFEDSHILHQANGNMVRVLYDELKQYSRAS